MPTTRIQDMSVELSKRLADEVSAYSTDGINFSSVQRLRALNQARQQIYGKLLGDMGVDEFIKQFPEFIVETDRSTAVTANVGSRFANSRHFISMKLVRLTAPAGTYDGTYLARRIPQEVYYEMNVDPEACPYATSGRDYGFIELNNTIKFYGEVNGVISGTYYGTYLRDMVAAAYADAGEIADPGFWTEQTIETAAGILLGQASVK